MSFAQRLATLIGEESISGFARRVAVISTVELKWWIWMPINWLSNT